MQLSKKRTEASTARFSVTARARRSRSFPRLGVHLPDGCDVERHSLKPFGQLFRTAGGMSRRVALFMAAFGITIVASPALVGYVRNELWASAALDALAPPLPPHTSIIKSTVGGAGTRCTELVARVLATTLAREQVARFVANGLTRAPSIAWSAPDGFWTWRAKRAHRVDEQTLPAPVHKLLTSYAFLPRGVHRLVVYRELPLPHRTDPRCWGST